MDTTQPSRGGEPIALIGSGCRFPGSSSSPSKLWTLLQTPRDVLNEIPDSRFNAETFYHPDGLHHGTTNVKHAYTLSEDPYSFDANFFGIKPVEADAMDPQHRLLLETVYESLEAAGLSISALSGTNTACYVGQMCNDYNDHLLRDFESIPTYFATGASRAITSNRVSYFYNWHGPSMTIDTACSSSLVAMHQAVQAIRSGESTVAIAAGVNLLLGPEWFVTESKLKMLSPDGRSRMWSSDANGYARGEGIACVVLKSLSDAIRDGDDIECVIRETGVNQDGKTSGITVPSSEAQKRLILDTYRKAGLDPYKQEDRCQFFEAHGTGTQAGDPREARAIAESFFNSTNSYANDERLYVGSIKTLIGHTEGAAGLAGVLKASLALRHAKIPANMHFNELNPAVKPFYDHLTIPTKLTEWPQVSSGQPRRASVNSFGFGGTNAHAILESYDPPHIANNGDEAMISLLPAVFSAHSEDSLRLSLKSYLEFLSSSDAGIDAHDLSRTLLRRSAFPIRAAFPAATIDTLRASIQSAVEKVGKESAEKVGTQSSKSSPCFLGIFTGQGAQWPSMGRRLIESSPTAATILDSLESSLKTLPETDRPTWSLRDELFAKGASSRLSEAALAQPLCTAVQIILVDLLHSTGLRFSAVVGHSSGEIAAAYAAGFLDAGSAIRVAYYRGLYAKLAGSGDKKGAMLAAGMDFETAKQFCRSTQFQGRLAVAASNSSSSVTLSGDSDAIQQAKDELDKTKTFARKLMVDTAYHSHHMNPCSGPYVAALQSCNISIHQPLQSNTCKWFSSVHGGRQMSSSDNALRDTYWRDNMTNTVLFSQALSAAISVSESFSSIIEVGPHPALRGPASQVISESVADQIPYTGLLNRSKNDADAFADALGYIWCHNANHSMDFSAFDTYASRKSHQAFSLPKGLPAYAWEHGRRFISESRYNRAIRSERPPPHELLGVRLPDGTEKEVRWRNVLSLKELPWISGHSLQGSVIFPAAGYASMAFEAAVQLAKGRSIQWLELFSLQIDRALVFPDESSGVEVMLSVTDVQEADGNIAAKFTLYSAAGKSASRLTPNASGTLLVTLGDRAMAKPTEQASAPPKLLTVDVDKFYDKLANIGYDYDGLFKGLSDMRRWTDASVGLIKDAADTDANTALMIHPATLDLSIQAMFSAYCSPGDGRLWSLHVPTRVDRILLNPALCKHQSDRLLPFHVTLQSAAAPKVTGHVQVLDASREEVFFQLNNVQLVPLSEATPDIDRLMFAKTVWEPAPGTLDFIKCPPVSLSEARISELLENLAFGYAKKHRWVRTTPEYKPGTGAAVRDLIMLRLDAKPVDWTHEYDEAMATLAAEHQLSPDFKFLQDVGPQLWKILEPGSHGSIEVQAESADSWVANGIGRESISSVFAQAIRNLSHGNCSMRIFELGSGGVSAAKTILRQLDSRFLSYECVGITEEEVSDISNELKLKPGKLLPSSLSLSAAEAELGEHEESVDLIVVSDPFFMLTVDSNVILRNAIRLLKPGGRLLMVNIYQDAPLRALLAAAALCSTTSSSDPFIRNVMEWDDLLRATGFTGVDSQMIVAEDPSGSGSFSIILTQTSDETLIKLQNPLFQLVENKTFDDLLLVGGRSLNTSKVIDQLVSMLKPTSKRVTRARTPEDITDISLTSSTSVLYLGDLDEPAFQNLHDGKIAGLKAMFEHAKIILWATLGSAQDDPFAAMSLGFIRTMRVESPQTVIQTLDLSPSNTINPTILADIFLKLQIMTDHQIPGVEPELALDGNTVMISRIMPNKEANDRYNSQRRRILQDVDPSKHAVVLDTSNETYIYRNGKALEQSQESIAVVVQISTMAPIPIDHKSSLFVFAGSRADTEEMVLGLSATRSSIVTVPESLLFAVASDTRLSGKVWELASHLLAKVLLSEVRTGEILLAHAPGLLRPSLEKMAAAEGKTIIFGDENVPQEVTRGHFHPRSALTVAAFVDLSGSAVTHEGLRSALPANTRVLSPGTTTPLLHSSTSLSAVQAIISASMASIAAKPETVEPSMITPINSTKVHGTDRFKLLDWSAATTLRIETEPVDQCYLFSNDRTYVLFGLTSTIGLSLAQWMVSRGAKHIVLTSRRATVDSKWLDWMRSIGAHVRVEACDISDRSDMEHLHAAISSSMPKIGGVANGAMVLKDCRFSDMTHEYWDAAVRPKVQGSLNIDQIFGKDDLDFFVMFSSVTAVCGSSGQSNYTAANAFMAGLAAQRRKNGLTASVIDLGVVSGIGYLAEGATKLVEDNLKRVSPYQVSERDIHLIFAEAVLAGKTQSFEAGEVVTGVERVPFNSSIQPYWHNNLRFQHYIEQDEQPQPGRDSKVALKDRLAAATSGEEVSEAVTDEVVEKMTSMLQLEEQPSSELLPKGIDELGVDSLNAVDIRSWLYKELSVDVPVLKILGGSTVGSLIDLVQSKLDPEVTPNLKRGTEQKQTQAVAKPAVPNELNKSQKPEKRQETRDSSVDSTTSKLRTRLSSSLDSGSEKGSSSASGAETPASSVNDDDVLSESSISKTIRVQRMSPRQSTFWFLKSYLRDPSTFNIACLWAVDGRIDKKNLARAVNSVAQHHEALRTRFFVDEAHNTMQGVMEKSHLHLETRDISSQQDAEVEYQALCDYDYDLVAGETMRIELLSLDPRSHFLLIGYSHINMDGVSLQVLMSDIDKAYNQQAFDRGVVQFPDYSERQYATIERGAHKEDVEYWKDVFSDMPPVLDLLPHAKVSSRQPLRDQNLNEAGFFVNKALAARIKEVCKKVKTTPFHFYLAAFQALLFRFTGSDDLVIGMADAGRTDADTLNAIGIYLNLLPLRFKRPESSEAFASSMKEAKRQVYAALSHSSVPFDILLDELQAVRSASYSPLFQAFFDYRQGAREELEFASSQLRTLKVAAGRTAYDLSIDIMENANGEPHVVLKAQASLYSSEATKAIQESYTRLIEAFASNPEMMVKEPSVFAPESIEEALTVGRGRDMTTTWPATIIHRIDDMIERNQESTAVKDGSGASLTYNAFAKRAAGLSTELRKAGLGAGAKVAVFQGATADWICSMFAIMRIGAAYVPLDLRNPLARNAKLVENAKPQAILVDDRTVSDALKLGFSDQAVLDVTKIASASPADVGNAAEAQFPAYILHTSGSTGTPKGIIVKHNSLVHQMEAYQNEWKLGPVHVLQQSAFSFDFSIDQIMTALSSGGSLFVVPTEHRGDPEAITKTITEEQITYTKATPSEYSSWIRHGMRNLRQSSQWKWAFAGGERLTPTNLAEFRELAKDGLGLYNSYGPAEITVSSHKAYIAYDKSTNDLEPAIPAGYSLPNYSTYIVDRDLQPVPVGFPGEVLIGGSGPAEGYLNLDKQTRAKFIPTPFAHDVYEQQGWTRAYRTGDYGRLRPDGALMFEGRLDGDTQIKLNGIRIELGEIESVLVSSSDGALIEAVASVRGDPQFLVAHVVFAQSTGITDQSSFLRSLKAKLPLPEYMVPAMVEAIDALPLSAHNKVDRRAIAELPLSGATAGGNDEAELTKEELQLKDVWARILSPDALSAAAITPSTDFFQLGGNSILLPRLQALIREELNVSLPLIDLLEAHTISSMASRIFAKSTSAQIEWEGEVGYKSSSLQASIQSSLEDISLPRSQPEVILMTGATGFLGRSLLAQLVSDPTIREIHCLAVRDRSKIRVSSPKIVIHDGDLTHPLLGLAEAELSSLAACADAVIHLAATRAFWEYFDAVRAVNFDAVKVLAELAIPRKVPFIFMSSGGLTVFTGEQNPPADVQMDESYAPPRDGEEGYLASKWASERWLLNMQKQTGVPLKMFRTMPLPVQNNERGVADSVLEEYVRLAKEMKLLPVVEEKMGGRYDVLGVETMAGRIVDSLENVSEGQVIECLDSTGRLGLKEMEKYIRGKFDQSGEYKDLDVLKWIGRAKAAGSQFMVSSHELLLEEGGKTMVSKR